MADDNRRDERRREMKKDFDIVNANSMGSNSQISWRGILAGLFVSSLAYAILVALGFAIGGLSLKAISLDDVEGFSIGAGIWLILSAVIALFIGGYITARTGTAASERLGAMQGVTTAALFFFVMAMQVGFGIGAIGAGAGDMLGFSLRNAGNIINQPAVQNVIEDATAGLELRRPTNEVVQGVAARLLRGDPDAARAYLIANSNISAAEADRRLSTLRAQFDEAISETQDTLGNIISTAGWTSFIMLVLGSAAALIGGALGSRANFQHPIIQRKVSVREDVRMAS